MRIRLTEEEFEKVKTLIPERVIDDLSSVYEQKKAKEKILRYIVRGLREKENLDLDLEVISQLESEMGKVLENED